MEYMNIALKEAKKAFIKNEVPVGAVLVKNGKIIAKAHNLREKKCDITAHAEILAIKKAAKVLKTWQLYDVDLYVTLKPCKMCDAVINQSRINNVYYLLNKEDSKFEYNKTIYTKIDLQTKYQELLTTFFKKKRK